MCEEKKTAIMQLTWPETPIPISTQTDRYKQNVLKKMSD